MKRSTCRVILVSLSALLLSACGGGGGGSAPPPPAPAPTLSSIAVTPQNPSTALNVRLQLTATGTYSDNSTRDITSSVTWSSANTALATVGASNGLVAPAVGAAANTVVITATSGALTGSTTITLTTIPTFSLAGCTANPAGCEPLASQQWGLLNTAQNGFADTVGVASTGTNGTDINVNNVYSTNGYTGYGVTVAVVDTGLELAHEDLTANVVSGGSWNFATNTNDPTNTVDTTGDHGTMVGGLIAMARNGKGGVGVAPTAQLKGFNLLAPNPSYVSTYGDYLAALGGSSANPNSRDVAIFNQSFGSGQPTDSPVDPWIEGQYAYGVNTLRGGKGALYVKSAGNGFNRLGTAVCTAGISCENANFDSSDVLPYNIVVAALNAKGMKSSYSTAGSAMWASAPGGETGWNSNAITAAGYVAPAAGAVIYDPAMVTTDQSGCAIGQSVNTPPTGFGPFSYFNWGGTYVNSINANCNYTNGMNGTSSAAPMMSGVIALILEANPALTWRDVKHILAMTSVQVDSAIAPVTVTAGMTGASVATPYVVEQGWVTNTAGRKFHNWYGFGAVDANAAVAMAKAACSAGCGLGAFANTGWVSGTIPATPNNVVADNSTVGVGVPVAVAAGAVAGNIVETVQVKVRTTSTAPNIAAGESACVTATVGCTGDIAIELTSPAGTKSILKTTRDGLSSPSFGSNVAGNLWSMVLASNAFYGETSTGTWTVKLVDGRVGHANQTVTDVQLRVYGH